jgi:hypothetical protein
MVATQDEITPKLLDVGQQAEVSSFRFTRRVRENVAAWRPRLVEGDVVLAVGKSDESVVN